MEEIVAPLLVWYQKNRRVLPWRVDKHPYHVWISEIMLQQTRIEAVKQYYQRFMEKVPTIQELANLPEDELLKLWQGLGYYNRARNLQKAAKIIMTDYQGVFPQQYREILALPGIGEYTASAIGSICFSLKEPVIDGNVLRVMMRLQNSSENVDNNKTKKQLRKKLLDIMPENSGDFNEALMELGETVCLPNTIPKCEICPLAVWCQANRNNTQLSLPIKEKKQIKKTELYTVLLFVYKDRVAITKREANGLLHNLWQFPNIEGIHTQKTLIDWLQEHTIEVDKIIPGNKYQHVFTHKIWHNQVYIVYVRKIISQYTWVTLSQLEKDFAIPTAFMPALQQYKNLSSKNN